MSNKILFVDDEINVLNSVKRNLSKMNITTSTSPFEALELLKKDTFAVIISDMRMPNMNGVEFLEKSCITAPDSVKIMLTGDSDYTTVSEAVNKGRIFKFLAKPVKTEELTEAILSGIQKYNEISLLKESYKKSLHNSLHDPLTGLPNKTLLKDRLFQAVEFNNRNRKKFGIMFIDLDNFKPVNDTYGHLAGDKLLIKFSEMLTNSLRGSDTIARVGGDEFIAVINGVLEPENLISVINKIFNCIKDDIHIDDEISCRIGCSVGISIYPDDSRDPLKLLEYADSAMYVSKKTVGNAFTFYSQIVINHDS